ncbi:MAG: DNA alkylation repair protein [Patescibacteria group bacterium]
MSSKTLGTISIIATLLVLFSVMLNPIVSVVIATIALIGLGVYHLFGKENKPLDIPTSKQTEEKEHNKEAIMGLMESGNQLITNEHIRQMLDISEATATRYLDEIEKNLNNLANPEKARLLSRYFKTSKGEYGEGDIFIGITVPNIRKVAYKFLDASFDDIQELLKSKIHEYRLTALEILVAQYERSKDEKLKEKIYKFYLKNTKYINNWDLVDLSACYIVGDFLFDKTINKNREVLYKLVRSKNLWERRIAVLSAGAFIKKGQYEDTFKIAEILMNDKHQLIHKAVGWMLREVGKQISHEVLKGFLNKHFREMPRIMLSYSLEHFSKREKGLYELR